MSLNDIRDLPVLADQLDRLEVMVTSMRPKVIVDELYALQQLLETFMSDGGERAPTVAALAVIELAKIRDPYWSAS